MKNYLLSFLLVFLVLGCKTVKQTHKSRENKQIVRVDSVFVEHTQTIKDTVYLTVPTIITEKSECDSLCQREVERLMQSFTFSKHNGSHSQGVYYNKYKKQLVLYQNLAEQLNYYKAHQEKQVEVKEIEHIKEVKHPYIPKFFWIMTIIGILSILVGLSFGITKLKRSL